MFRLQDLSVSAVIFGVHVFVSHKKVKQGITRVQTCKQIGNFIGYRGSEGSLFGLGY